MSDDHEMHVKAHEELLAEIIRNLEIFSGVSSIVRGNPPKLMTVNEWLSRKNISSNDILFYPNAKTAAEIKASPLYKALE